MRAFSFSDDSACVGLPFAARKPHTPNPDEPIQLASGSMWTRSSDVTLSYIAFRQLQSQWYTDLFQSGREPWTDPYPRIWAIYRNLENWHAHLPPETPPQVKTFLELDMLYSYVYILSPSPRCPQPNEHAQRLLAQHAANYAKHLLKALSEPGAINSLSPFSFYDAIRVYMVAKVYIDTLVSNLDGLLMPPRHPSTLSTHSSITLDVDVDPLSSATPQPPPLLAPQEAGVSDQPTHTQCSAQAAVQTIDAFLNVLSSFEMRFGRVLNVSWRDKIHQDSEWLVSQLKQRIDITKMVATLPASLVGGSVVGGSGSNALGTSPSRGVGGGGTYYPSPAASQ
jgi:hypothetical protein